MVFKTNCLQIVVSDIIFANCCGGSFVCKLSFWTTFLANYHSRQLVGKLSFWTIFLQIIDLINFLLQIVIVNCFFFFTNGCSSCISLKIVHLDNFSVICHCGSIILQIVVLDNFFSKFANCRFRQFFLQICKLSFWIIFLQQAVLDKWSASRWSGLTRKTEWFRLPRLSKWSRWSSAQDGQDGQVRLVNGVTWSGWAG